MTDRGNPTDINSLPDADIQELIKGNQQVAQEFGKQAKALKNELEPLETRVISMRREHAGLVTRAQAAQTEVRRLQNVLTERHKAESRANAVEDIARMLLRDADKFSKGQTAIALGISRVLTMVSYDQELRKGLPDLVDFDSSAPPTSQAKRINIKTVDQEGAHVRVDSMGSYTVGYHVKAQTPEAISSVIREVHAVGTADSYVLSNALRIRPNFIGFAVDIQGDNSALAIPIVSLESPRVNDGVSRTPRNEHRVLPQTETLARPVADYIGGILQVGNISLPQPQQIRR